MNSTIAKSIFFYPVRLFSGQNICHYFRYVKNFERLGSAELHQVQWDKLKRLLELSYAEIPYYKRLFLQNGLTPNDIKSPKDLLKIPPLTKKNIQENVDLFKNIKVNKHFKRSTSGSSGRPLTLYKDRHALACMDAVMYNAYSWHGINSGDRQARFWGMPFDGKGKKIAMLKDFLMNRRRSPAFNLSSNEFAMYYDKLKRFKPNYFYGYPSLIHEFAEYIKDTDKDLSFLNLKGIIGTGELILPQHKHKIETIFNCKFINEYGCTEAGVIGFDCPKGEMHLMAHNIYFEVLKNGNAVYDEEGEIYITELNSHSFPLIRYKIGDIGIISKRQCSCGLNLPVLKIRKGRIDSYIVTPSGLKIYDAVLAYTLKKGIRAFKAEQTELDLIRVFVKTNNEYSEDLQDRYIRILKQKIDPQMSIEFEAVEELPREHSGKLRYFIPYNLHSAGRI